MVKLSQHLLSSFKTIYSWIYDGRLVQRELQVLRHKGKRQKPNKNSW